MALGGRAAPENQRRPKMTKLRKIVGLAIVTLSLLTGFALSSNAHAQELEDAERFEAVVEVP